MQHWPVRVLFVLCAALMALNAAAEPAWDQNPPPRLIEDRFRLELGGWYSTFSTQLRVDPSLTVKGTPLNAEDDLGLASTRVIPLPELTLLPGTRHLIRLSAMSVRRHAEHVLDKTIVFQDDVYRTSERVDSELNLSMLGITYGYRVIRAERGELAATFGFQISEVEANVVVRSRSIRQSESGVGPLPMVGLEGRWDFSTRWSVEGRAQYVTANISNVKGTVSDLRLAGTWRMNPHLLFGLGYRRLSIKVDSQDQGTPGKLDYRQSGPELYLRASL